MEVCPTVKRVVKEAVWARLNLTFLLKVYKTVFNSLLFSLMYTLSHRSEGLEGPWA